MLGDTVEEALNKMRQTNQHQHSNGLLQEFYTMTQRHNEPIGKYSTRLDLAIGKVRLQSMEALVSTEEERGRLLMAKWVFAGPWPEIKNSGLYISHSLSWN